MNPLRVGLVGYGFGSRVFHVPLLQDLPEFSIAGVYSPSEATRERARHELGVPAYDRLESLLGDDGIDLAVISTPHDSHASLALQALAAGKNVVVDKVMCLTLEEADAMIAAARVGGIRRYDTVAGRGTAGPMLLWHGDSEYDRDGPDAGGAASRHRLELATLPWVYTRTD